MITNMSTNSTIRTPLNYVNGGSNVSSLEELEQLLLDKFFPLGTIIIMYTNDSPSDLLGGTWEEVSGMLYASDTTVSETNNTNTNIEEVSQISAEGSKTYTLKDSELVAHKHTLNFSVSGGGHTHSWDTAVDGSLSNVYMLETYAQADSARTVYFTPSWSEHTHTVNLTTQSAGGQSSFNIVPKSFVCKQWRRVG